MDMLIDVKLMLVFFLVGALIIAIVSLIFNEMIKKTDWDIMKVNLFILYIMCVIFVLIGTLSMIISI